MNAGEASVATEAHGVAQTAKDAPALIEGMRVLMAEYKQRILSDHPRVYSQDLLNNLFRHLYTRINMSSRNWVSLVRPRQDISTR